MLLEIKSELEKTNTTLVAVSKTKPNEMIQAMYDIGQRIFGENRVQELVDKYEALPKDIEWHMIGHLQSKKVKHIVSFIDLIHSVDSFKLLQEIDKQAAKIDRTIDVLLQFKIADEDTKYGFEMKDMEALFSSSDFKELSNIHICGVMGMATFTDDMDQVRSEFSILRHIHKQLKNQFFLEDATFKEISMGMSGDYTVAIEEGSTMVRIGSLLFGSRK